MMPAILADLPELIKLKIAALAIVSFITGFILADGALSSGLLLPALGLFLLASGSLALNQYQDRTIDALMERTKNRVIPSGRVSPIQALALAAGLILSGALVLVSVTPVCVSGLGIFTVFWYNGVYAFLKRKTHYAAVIGALIGVIPPCMGWLTAEGNLYHHRILILVSFLFLWQIPHFWLIILQCREDYEQCGLPNFKRQFSDTRIAAMSVIWILAIAVTGLLMPALDMTTIFVINIAMVVAAGWLMRNSFRLFDAGTCRPIINTVSLKLNAYVLFVMLMLIIDKVLW